MLDIESFLDAALDCSVFISPRKPGLAPKELKEAGRQAGFLDGEINDAIMRIGQPVPGAFERLPNPGRCALLVMFNDRVDPEFRNVDAFDFVMRALSFLERSEGERNAKLDRDVLAQRAIAEGFPSDEIEAAITCMVLGGMLKEDKGVVQFKQVSVIGPRMLYRDQVARFQRQNVHRREWHVKAHPVVKDIIARRSDGRPQSSEPLNGFPEILAKIGYPQFRIWWSQIVSELKQADPGSSPIAVAVLSAALVEGALTFACRYARDKNLSCFRSSDFDKDSKSWKLEKLIESAGASGILDAPTKTRAEGLYNFRQRIHAGGMLSVAAARPDLRPEEARDAKSTADLVVRQVSDWLDRELVKG